MNSKISLPNLFIIGAPKSGTTALVDGLGQHDDIFVPIKKEPRFFDAHIYFDDESDYPYASFDEYTKLFDFDSAKKCKYRVDGSVYIMYSEESIKNILEINPSSKFILLLRNPVDATKSMFMQRLKYTDTTLREVTNNFSEIFELINKRKLNSGFPKGCKSKNIFKYDLLYQYEEQVPSLLKAIDRKNLFIINYESFSTSADHVYERIMAFLEIENRPIVNRHVNTAHYVNRSFSSDVLWKITRSTQRLRNRHKINSNGIQILKFMRILRNGSPIHRKVDTSFDDSLNIVFKNTLEYLVGFDFDV